MCENKEVLRFQTITSRENSLSRQERGGNRPHDPVTSCLSVPGHVGITIQDETWVGKQSQITAERAAQRGETTCSSFWSASDWTCHGFPLRESVTALM